MTTAQAVAGGIVRGYGAGLKLSGFVLSVDTTAILGTYPIDTTGATMGQGLIFNGTEYVPGAPGSAPTGAAGGDLGGTYPNPTVTNITLASAAQGDVYYRNATTLARLPAGTAGYYLTTGGAGANPSWTAPATSLPPNGAAGGGLAGTYPNPTLATSQSPAVTWSNLQTFGAGVSFPTGQKVSGVVELTYNVATGNAHHFQVNAVDVMQVSSTFLLAPGELRLSGTRAAMDDNGTSITIGQGLTATAGILSLNGGGSSGGGVIIEVDGGGAGNTAWLAGKVTGSTGTGIQVQTEGGIRRQLRAVSNNASVLVNDYYVSVDTSGGSYTMTLPTIASVGQGATFEIFDATGHAAANNLVIASSGGDTINGAASKSITTNRGGARVIAKGNDWEAQAQTAL